MLGKKIATFLAVCIGSAAITLLVMKVLDSQLHLSNRLGLRPSTGQAPAK
ncbi:MAG: hypothetical protein HY235_30285 [Acidobacteria bacterium]|nr:hypothetical protein [Acidobacteriota bacterium]